MAIRIVHQPTAASLGVPYAAGVGRAGQRRRKYMLDLWQRDQYMNARLGGMGGRLGRRTSDEVQRQLVDPLADIKAADLSDPHSRRLRRQQQAQMRRGEGALVPQWEVIDQDALDIQAKQDREDLVRQEGREHDIDMLRRRGNQSDLQSLAEAITAEPQEGGPVYSPEQQRDAQLIIGNPGLSPEEQFTKLQEIFSEPKGVPAPSHVDQWKASTRPYDRRTLEPLEEGAEGEHVMRLPVDKQGNLDREGAQDLIAIQQSLNPDTSEEDAKKEKEKQAEYKKARVAARTAEKAYNTAQMAVATANADDSDLSGGENVKLLERQAEIAKEEWEDAKRELDALNEEKWARQREEMMAKDFSGMSPLELSGIQDPREGLPEGARMAGPGIVEYNGRRYRRKPQ